MEEDEVSWERVVYEARKKPDDPIAKVFLETEEKLVALEKELALCEMHCQEQAQRLDALREALDKAEQLAAIDKWPERYPRVYRRMTAALNKEGE